MTYNDAVAQRSNFANRTILVIDDSAAVCTAFDVLLSLHGARVIGALLPAQALEVLAHERVDLVIQDMNFRREATSGEEGIALFQAIRRQHPELPIILLTAWTNLETAVDLVKAGAADYIAKPWNDARLLTTIRNLLDLGAARAESSAIRFERRQARMTLEERFDLCGIVYESEAIHTLVATATQVAHAEVPVLITGPHGSGKEVLADIIQANSLVSGQAYIKVNLGALPNDLIEAELFGTEPGAFTGALPRIGRFEAANGGTLFLDELGNLSASGQAKLLRILQSGEFEHLGSSTTRRARVRVLAATNTSLPQAIREHRFREDLLYRLNVIELEVPPLAERAEDILPLARHFLQVGFTLTPEAEQALLRHAWPGNVRELQNAIRRACLLSPGPVIDSAALSLPTSSPAPKEESAMDRVTVERALERARGVVAHAARDLGLTRQALYRRMEKFGLKSDVGRPLSSS